MKYEKCIVHVMYATRAKVAFSIQLFQIWKKCIHLCLIEAHCPSDRTFHQHTNEKTMSLDKIVEPVLPSFLPDFWESIFDITPRCKLVCWTHYLVVSQTVKHTRVVQIWPGILKKKVYFNFKNTKLSYIFSRYSRSHATHFCHLSGSFRMPFS